MRNGVITIYVQDLNGDEYALQATSTNEGEINSNQSFSAMILPTKVNKTFIDRITEMWNVVDHDGVEHKIIYFKKKGEGDSLSVNIKAIPLFFDVLDNDRIYERIDKHMTAMEAFTKVFSGTGFGFVLVDSFSAVNWEGFGDGETNLESFKRAIKRYKCEFRIVGRTVYLEKQIGRDTQFMYRHRLNASNIIQEVDANKMWTYARGYGDYEDGESESGDGGWENANLVREYTSPLAKIIGIRHGPPIKDGRVKVASEMDASLRTLVDDSLKVSVSADIHDLRKQGYPLAQSELGDRVFLIDERIDLNDEVRIVTQSITRNWKGEVIDLKITFGSEGIVKRHQGNISTAIKNITELLEGKKTLPNTVFDSSIVNAAKAIKNARTELIFPGQGGIWGVDKDNPNYVTGMTSGGFMVSKDGGATPIAAVTGEGVVAETIIGNAIIGVNLSSVDERGYFHVNGSDAEFFDSTTDRRVTISPNGIYGYNANNNIRFQADYQLVYSSALGTSNTNVYLAAVPSSEHGAEARVVDYRDIPGDGEVGSYRYHPLRARGFHGNYLAVNQSGTSGVHLYLNPATNGEVRSTSRSDSSVYRAFRGSGFYGTFLNARTDATSNHLYARPKSGGELRVTRSETTDNYLPIRADGYLNAPQSLIGMTSFLLAAPKSNEATEIINSLNLLRYTNGSLPEFEIINETSPVLANEGATDISKTLKYILKSIQEIDARMKTVEGVS